MCDDPWQCEGYGLIDIHCGPAVFNDGTDELVGQKRVRATVTGFHAHGGWQDFPVGRLFVSLDFYLPLRIPVRVNHGLALFADLYRRVRRPFRPFHDVGHQAPVDASPLGPTRRHMPED